ncbi:hypothetical protein O3M35_004544 [Rhynocoris fuscipes]|uniref:receptor protein-tyrosine kinase n=1 Tax=Rhynocoris fuscipes TaxID=488301 RepID=A0AAW1CK73_9HEMI
MFSKLKGCKVVEGFVSIALIDNINLNDYRNITFPELREITGYLLLYRVYALKSIGKLFPKLSVIRGHTLFLNYALLVFEMLNLQELGLVSLTNILRGSVYIAKNPMLCFVHTINWNLIAPESNEFKYITGNKLRNECPVCSVELNCPTSGNTGEALCWNVDHCQIVCPKHCGGSCNADGKCCHLECLGGCDAGGQSSDHCFSCRNVLFENKCISKCPANTYKYLNRRCVYESECYDMPKPREINKYNIKPNPWKPFRNECVLECPSNFLEVDIGISGQQKLSCELCEGNCRKECPGAKIDSPASAMTMRGCTLIRGSLEIQMRGGSNIVRELEDNLSSIEEITGYLKVVRSFALLSLNFLKKLKVIHGEILESSIYSLVILDNQNLMELWDWDKRERIFNIKSGRLFFHFNPKLCRSKIDELKEIANLSDYSELEVASNSNGHKVACNVTRLKAFIEKKSSVVAIVHWTQFEHYDPRKVLGYMVYYIEAPFRNITMFGGRDACGGDEWKVIDVSADENVTERGFHQTIITKLKPYTQYAYYVKTYTIASEKTGAISPIQYFRTNASTPSPPRSLNAYSNSSSELVITWLPPSEPNGNGTHYKLTAIWVRDTDEFVEQRNYCNEPRTTPPTSSQEAQIPPEDNQEDFQMKYCPSCGCAPKKVNSDNREKEIKFEDSLQNFVYIKR